MSDSALSQRQAGRRVLKRHDWLPNRMFDPANNPFAIQNLLAREREKEDALFHVDVDERPEATYAGNALLRDTHSLPPKDFRKNALLVDPAAERHEFLAEYDDTEDDGEAMMDEAPVVASSSSLTDVPPSDIAGPAESMPDTATDAGLAVASDADTDPQLDHPVPDPQATLAEAAPVEVPAASRDDTDTEEVVDLAPHDEAVEHRQGSDAAADGTAQPTDNSADEQGEERVAEQAMPAPVTDDMAADQVAPDAERMNETVSAHAASATESMPQQSEPPESLAGPEALGQPEPPLEQPTESPLEGRTESAEGSPSDVHLQADAPSDLSEPLPPETAAEPALNSAAIESLLQAAREEAREQGRQEAREAAYQEGLEAGIAQAKAELQQAIDGQRAQLAQIIDSLQKLSEDPDTLFEPMKKLAVHLAEQLVRGELAQSPQTISRLVDNCLRELAASGEKAVIVHLNPEDLEQYKPLIAPFGDSLVLRPDALLARGSVRASLDGSVVEDLIERRVKGISKSLAQPMAAGWRPSAPNPVLQRSQPARKAPAPAASTETPNHQEVADDASAEGLDQDVAAEPAGSSMAGEPGDLLSAELSGSDSPAEAGDSAAP